MSQLRDRGHRGGRIAPHRAMIGLDLSWTLAVDLLVIPLIFVASVWLLLDPITDGWATYFEVVREPLGMTGSVQRSLYQLGPVTVSIPYFNTPGDWPDARHLEIGWFVTVGAFASSFLMSGRMLPLGYFLRFLAILQLTAQLWFSVASPPFAYGLPTYMTGLLAFGVVVLLLIPYLVAFTFNIFDFLLWQKFLLGTLLISHLVVLLPLQATVHAWIIHRASLLAVPVLFLLFGVLLILFVYIALYGWGMSWRSGGSLDAMDRRPPTVPPRYPEGRLRPTPRPQSVAVIPSIAVRMNRALAFRSVLFSRFGYGNRK